MHVFPNLFIITNFHGSKKNNIKIKSLVELKMDNKI